MSKKKKVRHHKFKLGRYNIDYFEDLEGICDVPSEKNELNMLIRQDNTIRGLISALHEAMHAEGIPDEFLDGKHDSAEYIARFLWRLGYRK